MRREGILCLLLTGWATGARAEVPPPEPVALQAEVEQLRQEREALEARVRVLQAQLGDARATAAGARVQVEQLEFRCKQLQEELRLARAGKPVALPPTPGPAEVEAPKPRPRPVRPGVARGQITAVGRDGKLMQVSVGLESGVKPGQNLDVYRLGDPKERPLYLGTVELIRVDAGAALGQYHGVMSLGHKPRVGDRVASDLSAK